MYYDISAETHSLYIHWPFCPYRCHYCPFVALASHDPFMERYHQALVKEIKDYAHGYTQKGVLNTIYFGGGTPSTYPDHLLLDTFGILGEFFRFDEKTEITIEVNPGTVRSEQLELWKKLGINRMSVGVQSLNDEILKKLNRLQKASDVYLLLDKAPLFFDNISVDIILGLPGVSPAEWKSLLKEIVTWRIKHISMYVLEVHDTTPLFFSIASKKVSLACDDEIAELYYWSRDFLQEHGFNQYEISSFAREGYESRHNSMYWDRKAYRGFGLGACSFDGARRYQNEKNLMKYMESVEQNRYAPVFVETITEDQEYTEKLMLGLRRVKGIVLHEVMSGLKQEQKAVLLARIDMLKQEKLLIDDNGYVRLTPAGLIVENEIITRLSL